METGGVGRVCPSATSPFCLEFFSCLGDWEQALPIFDMLVKTENYCMVSEGLFTCFFFSLRLREVQWTSKLIDPIFTMETIEITSRNVQN